MIWRIFKRRKNTDAKVDEPVREVEASEPSTADATPSLSGFYFESTKTTAREPVQPAPQQSPAPIGEYAAAVRERTRRRRNVSTADRGVTPVLIPSLMEQASLYRMAAELRAATEPDTALALWDAYLGLCPEDADAWFVYGQCLAGMGAWEQARDAFTEASRLSPEAHLPVAALGFVAGQMGDGPAEVGFYEDAAHLSGDAVEMLVALHDAQRRAGLESAAVETHERIEVLRAES